MAITKDDTHHTNDYGDIPLHQEVNLRGTERIVVVTSNTMSDFPFILQHKIFIMSLFGIKAPSASANTPLVTPTLATPTSIQTKVQAIMSGIKATAPSRDDH